MKNEIVKIKASDYGLDSTKAQEIEAMFTPMLERMKTLEKEYNKIIKLPITPETCYAAKELRLQYVRVRTGTAEIHKELKAFYLNGGRFVDGWKNAQLFASQEIEESLKKIENHYEMIEAERKARLKEERVAKISPYVEDVNTYMLGEMSEDAFEKLLAGSKMQYDTRIAAEKKAEEERIAKEKADAEEREAQRLENIRLQKEADKREKQIAAEREKVRKEAERREKQLADEREAARKEQEAKDKQLADERARAQKEAEKREKLEADIRAIDEAKAKAAQDAERKRKADEKAAQLAPDKNKLLNFCQAINDLPRPEVKSIEAADIASKANILLVKTVNFIKENAEKL